MEGALADWTAVTQMADAPDGIKRLAGDVIRKMGQDG